MHRSFVELAAFVVAASSLFAARSAEAAVTKKGTWPAQDPKISLDVSDVPRGEAIKKLADAAGWSVITTGVSPETTTLHIKDQPASKVLDILLDDGDYIAKRDGVLVVVTRSGDAKSPPLLVPPIPPVPPVPSIAPLPPQPPVAAKDDDDDDDDREQAKADAEQAKEEAKEADDDAKDGARGPDRTITGGNLRVEKNEVVHDVTVMGGNVDIFGRVTGDVSVMGGNAHIHAGAHVSGDAQAVGGALTLDSGSLVDGDVGVLGGVLKRDTGAIVKGDVDESAADRARHDEDRAKEAEKRANDRAKDLEARAEQRAKEVEQRADQRAREMDERATQRAIAEAERDKARAERDRQRAERDRQRADAEAQRPKPSGLQAVVRKVGDLVTLCALFFVFGTVLLALATSRMERLRLEIAARPMRSFATGILGFAVLLAVLTGLCITIVGIPFAIIVACLAIVATLSGMISVFETTGGALLAHKTKNPYVHLAFGAAVFLLVGQIPFLGGLAWFFLVFTAFGSVVATRAAGLVPAKANGASGSPYRDAIPA